MGDDLDRRRFTKPNLSITMLAIDITDLKTCVGNVDEHCGEEYFFWK